VCQFTQQPYQVLLALRFQRLFQIDTRDADSISKQEEDSDTDYNVAQSCSSFTFPEIFFHEPFLYFVRKLPDLGDIAAQLPGQQSFFNVLANSLRFLAIDLDKFLIVDLFRRAIKNKHATIQSDCPGAVLLYQIEKV
jgi:hypothetical protein